MSKHILIHSDRKLGNVVVEINLEWGHGAMRGKRPKGTALSEIEKSKICKYGLEMGTANRLPQLPRSKGLGPSGPHPTLP